MDGNELRCEGAISLINRIAEECENEWLRKEAEERAKEEEEAARAAGERDVPTEGEATDAEPKTDAEKTDGEKSDGDKAKKKKKKKKSKLRVRLVILFRYKVSLIF